MKRDIYQNHNIHRSQDTAKMARRLLVIQSTWTDGTKESLNRETIEIERLSDLSRMVSSASWENTVSVVLAVKQLSVLVSVRSVTYAQSMMHIYTISLSLYGFVIKNRCSWWRAISSEVVVCIEVYTFAYIQRNNFELYTFLYSSSCGCPWLCTRTLIQFVKWLFSVWQRHLSTIACDSLVHAN